MDSQRYGTFTANFLKFAKHKYKAILKISQKHIAVILLVCGLFLHWNAFRADAAGDKAPGLKTVCIDAGHGGKDVGCISRDKKTHESDITLDVAARLSALIKEKYPDVNVVMTRSTDVFVTLGGRADIANRKGADLFISIHVDSAPSSTSANGYSIHVLGQSSHKDRDLFAYNMEVCRRENSVMLMEDDYSTKYQGFDPTDPESFIFFNLMQNSHLEQSLMFAQDVESAFASGPIRKSRGIWQNPFYVLWKTSMPAALVELGFMSNASDLAVLRTEDGREKIAGRLLSAFSVFKKRYDSSVNAGTETAPAEVNAAADSSSETASGARTAEARENDGPSYGVQIMASPKKLEQKNPSFKGYSATAVRSGNLYKYIVKVSSDIDEVRKSFSEVRKSFPGSFLVEFSGDSVKPYRSGK